MKKHHEEEQSKPPKRPYESPCVEESGRFERLVLSCGAQAGVCSLPPFQS
jgi:hypothetical protein